MIHLIPLLWYLAVPVAALVYGLLAVCTRSLRREAFFVYGVAACAVLPVISVVGVFVSSLLPNDSSPRMESVGLDLGPEWPWQLISNGVLGVGVVLAVSCLDAVVAESRSVRK